MRKISLVTDSRDEELSGIVSELTRAHEGRGLTRYKVSSERSPILERIVSNAFPSDQAERADVLVELIMEAIGRLEADDSRKYFEDAEAARRLFGLTSRTKGRKLEERELEAGRAYARPKARHTFRTAHKPRILADLAQLILQLESEGPILEPNSPSIDLTYIPRSDIEERFKYLRREREGVFLLYGDAGTGKSSLAHVLAMTCTYDPNQIWTIHLDDQDTYLREMADYLIAYGNQDARSLGSSTLIARAFATVVGTRNAPRVLVLDGAVDWNGVRACLPVHLSAIESIVIITSRTKILPPDMGSALLIDNMTEGQAVSMVQSRISNISSDDARLLALELDCRPLAIEHGCVLIREEGEQGSSVKQFCDELRADTVLLLDSVPGEYKLTVIYRRLIRELESSQGLVLGWRLLDQLSSLGNRVPLDILEAVWQVSVGSEISTNASETNERLVQRSLRSAIRTLEMLALIQVVKNEAPNPDHIRMHSLTHSIIASLRKVERRATAEITLQSIKKQLDQIKWRGGVPLSHTICHWREHVLQALLSVGFLSLEQVRRYDILRTMAYILRSGRQERDLDHIWVLRAVLIFTEYKPKISSCPDLEAGLRSLATEIICSG